MRMGYGGKYRFVQFNKDIRIMEKIEKREIRKAIRCHELENTLREDESGIINERESRYPVTGQ